MLAAAGPQRTQLFSLFWQSRKTLVPPPAENSAFSLFWQSRKTLGPLPANSSPFITVLAKPENARARCLQRTQLLSMFYRHRFTKSPGGPSLTSLGPWREPLDIFDLF